MTTYLSVADDKSNMVTETDPPRPENAPAGYDEEDPYADQDITEYPDWWKQNIEQFREYGLRPYRPPRFTDGEHVPEITREVEAEFDVDVLIRAVEPRLGDDWTVIVDGQEVETIGRHRSGDGYTMYEITSDEFKSIVRSAVE